MNYINLSDNNESSMSNYGTESATSSYMPSKFLLHKKDKKDKKGGFWFFPNNTESIAIKACREREFGALSFIIRNDIVTDFCQVDETNKCTVLHYVCKFCNSIPHVDIVINKILSSSNVSTFINLQDETGNTPLHIALENDNHELCNILIQAGANPQIKNHKGKYILTDDEPVIYKSSVGRINNNTDVDESVNIIKHIDIVKHINSHSSNSPSVFAKKNESRQHNNNNNDNDDDDFVKLLLALADKKQPEYTQYSTDMPTYLPETSMTATPLLDTEAFINEIIKNGPNMKQVDVPVKTQDLNKIPLNLMEGGKSRNSIKIIVSRRMNLYSEFDSIIGGSSENDSNSDDYNEPYKLGRDTTNQVDVIHERTIEKIMEIMKVPRDVARNYKAVLYKDVKDNNPNLNSFERATEMEKNATEKILKKIDIEKKTKEIEQHMKEKRAMQDMSSDSDKNNKNKESSTSSMMSDSSFSATSYE
jgi:hypothetical protein